MKKLIISALAAGAIAGSAYTISAIAAPEAAMHEGAGFMLDAKLAGIHAALKLTPDQEKTWAPFEASVRDAAKARMEARRALHEERDSDERPSPIAMMNEMSDHLAKASEQLKKVADAAKPLYDSLDEGQKRHFGPLVRMLRPDGGHRGWHDEGGEHGPRPL